MLRFIIDTQLPARLCELLDLLGYDSIHTSHFPDGHLMKDKAIREIAINENRIILTKDSDFYDYYHVKGAPPAILLLTLGNISNSDLFHKLKYYNSSIQDLFLAGSNLVIFDGENLIGF